MKDVNGAGYVTKFASNKEENGGYLTGTAISKLGEQTKRLHQKCNQKKVQGKDTTFSPYSLNDSYWLGDTEQNPCSNVGKHCLSVLLPLISNAVIELCK